MDQTSGFEDEAPLQPGRWQDAGEFTSFTILTGPSAGHLSDYHDRAPVILEPAEWNAWLDPAQDADELMAAVRPDRFEVRVSA